MRWVWAGALWSALALIAFVALSGWASTVAIFWLLGLIAMTGAALASPGGDQIVVYGPYGQSDRVNEREALRRVNDHGWSYEPPKRRSDG